MPSSETASVHEPTEPVLVDLSADPTARWCRVGRNPSSPEADRAICAAHHARLRRAHSARLRRQRLRGLLLWFKALLRR